MGAILSRPQYVVIGNQWGQQTQRRARLGKWLQQLAPRDKFTERKCLLLQPDNKRIQRVWYDLINHRCHLPVMIREQWY